MILDDIKQLFHTGDRFPLREVKRMLQTAYDKNGINKKAKTTDLVLFGVKTKRTIISNDGRRYEGVKVILIE